MIKYRSCSIPIAAAGDTIITAEVSHRSRSTKQLCEAIDTIQRKRLKLEIMVSITIDCRSGSLDPMTKAFLQMSGIFAELELSMMRARVRSGMANARAKGRKIGRPQATVEDISAAFLQHYPAYKKGSLNVSELARVCDISRTTAYKKNRSRCFGVFWGAASQICLHLCPEGRDRGVAVVQPTASNSPPDCCI